MSKYYELASDRTDVSAITVTDILGRSLLLEAGKKVQPVDVDQELALIKTPGVVASKTSTKENGAK